MIFNIVRMVLIITIQVEKIFHKIFVTKTCHESTYFKEYLISTLLAPQLFVEGF